MGSGSGTERGTWRATAKELEHHSAVGTANFMAPEIITDRRYDKSVDWWACGVTMYVCATREHLFKGSNPPDIFHQIIHGEIDLSKLNSISNDLTSLVSGFLDRDYKKRLGTTGTREIKRHKFFQCPNFDTVVRSHPKLEPQHFEELTVTEEEKAAGEKLFRGHGKTKESGRGSTRIKDRSRSLRNKKKLGRSGPFSGGYYRNRQELLEKLSSHAIVPSRTETTPTGPTEGKKLSSMKLYERLLSAGHNSSHNVIEMSIAEDDEYSEDEDREGGSGGEGDESMQSGSTAAMLTSHLSEDMTHHADERVLHSSVYDAAALAAAATSVANSEAV
jgi:serine/threonine protein kinase